MSEQLKGLALLEEQKKWVTKLQRLIELRTPEEVEEWDDPQTYEDMLAEAMYYVSLEQLKQSQLEQRLVELAGEIGKIQGGLEQYEKQMSLQEKMWERAHLYKLTNERSILQALWGLNQTE